MNRHQFLMASAALAASLPAIDPSKALATTEPIRGLAPRILLHDRLNPGQIARYEKTPFAPAVLTSKHLFPDNLPLLEGTDFIIPFAFTAPPEDKYVVKLLDDAYHFGTPPHFINWDVKWDREISSAFEEHTTILHHPDNLGYVRETWKQPKFYPNVKYYASHAVTPGIVYWLPPAWLLGIVAEYPDTGEYGMAVIRPDFIVKYDIYQRNDHFARGG